MYTTVNTPVNDKSQNIVTKNVPAKTHTEKPKENVKAETVIPFDEKEMKDF